MVAKTRNIAFVDGQNLHLGTKEDGWSVNHRSFREYLRAKYEVGEAYWFLGHVVEEYQSLYDNLQKAGFIIKFKEHSRVMGSLKKGNVDTDLVFEVMKKLVDEQDFFEKIVLVSGDGDYKKMVDYLIKKERFEKILFPNKRASSLYKKLGSEYFDYLANNNVKSIIEYKK